MFAAIAACGARCSCCECEVRAAQIARRSALYTLPNHEFFKRKFLKLAAFLVFAWRGGGGGATLNSALLLTEHFVVLSLDQFFCGTPGHRDHGIGLGNQGL